MKAILITEDDKRIARFGVSQLNQKPNGLIKPEYDLGRNPDESPRESETFPSDEIDGLYTMDGSEVHPSDIPTEREDADDFADYR